MNDTWKRYESALEQMGADALCDAIAKALGGEQLESTLKLLSGAMSWTLTRRTKTMINDVFYSHDLKCYIRQISKRAARKLWDDGREIYFHSSNMRFDNMWQHPMPASKDGYSFVGYTFDQVCSSYECYNCDNERGRYIHFFVKAD